MKLVYLNALRAVEATLRLGTIKLAAEELGVTTAAVGQQIRALEDYLGRPLFERLSTGVRPAEDLLRAAPQLNASMSGLASVLRDLQPAADGNRISVTLSPGLAENWLSTELADFFGMLQDADLRIHTSKTPEDLSSGQLDFAVRSIREPGEEFDAEWLFPSGVVPICTPEFAQTYGLTPDRIDLRGLPLCYVAFGPADTLWGQWNAWCETFGIAFPGSSAPRISTFNNGLRLERVRLGLTLGGLIESYPMLRSGEVVMPFGPGSVAYSGFSFWLLCLKHRRLSAAQRTFKDWFLERARAAREGMAAHFRDMPQGPAKH